MPGILMSILGGTKHWMGPVVGAIVVVTLNDRLNRAGFQEISSLRRSLVLPSRSWLAFSGDASTRRHLERFGEMSLHISVP